MHRSLITKLKTGVLPLLIETGRFKGIPLNERICQICNCGEPETEYHFILHCTSLQVEREEFLSKVSEIVDVTNLTDDKVLRALLQPELLKLTGKHLEILLEKRKTLMFRPNT